MRLAEPEKKTQPSVTSLIGSVFWHSYKGDLPHSMMRNKKFIQAFKDRLVKTLATISPDYCLVTTDRHFGILMTETCYEMGIPYIIVMPKDMPNPCSRDPKSHRDKSKFLYKHAVTFTSLNEPEDTALRNRLIEEYRQRMIVGDSHGFSKSWKAIPWMFRNLYMLYHSDHAVLTQVRRDSPVWKYTNEMARQLLESESKSPLCHIIYFDIEDMIEWIVKPSSLF